MSLNVIPSGLPLTDQLQYCTVKIWSNKALPEEYGIGFFVGPGLILTCYHVIATASQEQIDIMPRDDSGGQIGPDGRLIDKLNYFK